VALGAADDRVDAGDQLLPVEGLGHVVVGAEAEAPQLAFGAVVAREDEDGRLDPREAELAKNLVPRHVGEVEVEKDQVVVVELGQVDPLLPEIGGIDVQVGMREHQLDAARGGRIVFDEADSHPRFLPLVQPCAQL
jgi:hypothetical protein